MIYSTFFLLILVLVFNIRAASSTDIRPTIHHNGVGMVGGESPHRNYSIPDRRKTKAKNTKKSKVLQKSTKQSRTSSKGTKKSKKSHISKF